MYLTEKFCYLEMMRSGSTHLHKLFKEFAPEGKQIGHHGPPDKDIINSNRKFVGSIRDPWSWYLSVWSYGCENGGHLHYRLTEKKIYFDHLGFKIKPYSFLYVFFQQFFKPLQQWRLLFNDVDNYENFRKFLKMIYNKKRIYDLGDGYAFSPMNNFAGLMTYYYVNLHSSKRLLIFKKNFVDNYEQLRDFDKKYNLLDFTIKTNNLEEDFFKFFKINNYKIDLTKKDEVRNLVKTAKSSKQKDLDYYYDKETVELISLKEKFIIEKYNYKYES